MGVMLAHWESCVRQGLCKAPENSDAPANIRTVSSSTTASTAGRASGEGTTDKPTTHPKACFLLKNVGHGVLEMAEY